jgi:hypothetical protein
MGVVNIEGTVTGVAEHEKVNFFGHAPVVNIW